MSLPCPHVQSLALDKSGNNKWPLTLEAVAQASHSAVRPCSAHLVSARTTESLSGRLSALAWGLHRAILLGCWRVGCSGSAQEYQRSTHIFDSNTTCG